MQQVVQVQQDSDDGSDIYIETNNETPEVNNDTK